MTAPTYAELSAAYRELFALIDPDTATERYEDAASSFYAEHRISAPGKDAPRGGGDFVAPEERQRRWSEHLHKLRAQAVLQFRVMVKRLEPRPELTLTAFRLIPGECPECHRLSESCERCGWVKP